VSSPVNIELALITRVIVDGDFHTLDKVQITEEFFSNAEALEVYRYLKGVYYDPASVGCVPSIEMVQYRFPAFRPFMTNDSVPVLASQLRQEKMRIDLLMLSQNLQVEAERNPLEAIASLRTESARISALAEAGEDLSMAGVSRMLREQYETVAQTGGVIGIPYPWEVLNTETQGMQGGQFIILYGRPKSMKTWVAIWMARYCYMECRKRVLFYTREMSPRLVAQRVAAAIARVDYKAFKNGTLQPELKQRTFDILDTLMEDEKSAGQYGYHQPFFQIVSDRSASRGGGGGGVGWLQSKIRDLKPDIVFVDGMYLMKDDRTNSRSVDWKNIAHISQDLKLTSQDFDIPVIGITQANRAADKSKGEDLTELAYADALGQDADAVFRISKKTKIDENTKRKTTELYMTAPGLREGEFDGIVLSAFPATGFDYLRTLIPGDSDEEYTEKKGGEKPKYRRTFMDPRIPVAR
jgi:replicative DNA helicase